MTEEPKQADAARRAGTGRLADLVGEPQAPSFRENFPVVTRVKVVVLAGLFVAFNAWQFPALYRGWLDPNWSHGFVIPLFSLFLIYNRWHEILRARRRVCLWGLPLVILGILLTILGFFPLRQWTVSQYSMVVLMFGLVLYLAGPQMARLLWLPIFFLLFAMPIPDMIYTRIATPLQEIAAAGSTAVLGMCGVTIHRTASTIDLVSISGVDRQLSVIEACAGLRLLMAFVALAVATAYLTDRPIWQRVVLVAAGIPIAVLCNVLRVTITATMFVFDRPELGQDFMHNFTGMLMLVPAGVLLWLLGMLLRSLFVEVEEDEGGSSPAAQEAKA